LKGFYPSKKILIWFYLNKFQKRQMVLKKIIYHLGEALIEVEATIKEEKTIPKGHFAHKRRCRNLKKHRHKCLTDFLSHKSDGSKSPFSIMS